MTQNTVFCILGTLFFYLAFFFVPNIFLYLTSLTEKNLFLFRYFKVLIQEMNVKLEKDFLLAIYKMLYGDCSVEHDEVILRS